MTQNKYVESPYKCTTCGEVYANRKQAVRHILFALGLVLDSNVGTSIERRFIVEDRVL